MAATVAVFVCAMPWGIQYQDRPCDANSVKVINEELNTNVWHAAVPTVAHKVAKKKPKASKNNTNKEERLKQKCLKIRDKIANTKSRLRQGAKAKTFNKLNDKLKEQLALEKQYCSSK